MVSKIKKELINFLKLISDKTRLRIIEVSIGKVTDIKDIISYGVMKTPALVVDEQVKLVGKVSTAEEIKKYL